MNKTERPTERIWTWVLISLIILVLGVRLSFVGHGAMSFPDEERYYQSVEAVKSFAAGNLKAGGAQLLHTQGRPGDAVLRLLPAAAQGVLHALGGPGPHALASLLLPVLFTYAVSGLSLLLYYRVARLLGAEKLGALLSTLVYVCLANSNVYIRHILPYEPALCSFFGLLVWVMQRQQQGYPLTIWKTYLLGAGAAFTFTIYPGYFFVPAILLVLLSEKPASLRRRFYELGAFGGGALSVLLLFKILGQWTSNYSYLRSCLWLSGSIIQGDFEESFSFLFKYLWEVEGWLGLTLLVLTGSGLIVCLYQATRSKGRVSGPELLRGKALYLGVLSSFLAYAALGYWGHKLVFYGRILHLFLPFLVLFAVGASYRFVAPKIRLPFGVMLAAVALYSFGRFAAQYQMVQYPLDFLRQPSSSVRQQKLVFLNQAEASDVDDYLLARQNLAHSTATKGEAILLNFSFLYPIAGPSCNAIRVPNGYRLEFSSPHFLTIPAYGFEGFTSYERAMLRRCQYQCQVFVRQ